MLLLGWVTVNYVVLDLLITLHAFYVSKATAMTAKRISMGIIQLLPDGPC